MNEEPAARTRARLEKTKGRHRAKIEILNEILNWIELGKSFEDIQQHCSLSIEYHDMQVEVIKEQIRSLFIPGRNEEDFNDRPDEMGNPRSTDQK
jgi:hypothetical protein